MEAGCLEWCVVIGLILREATVIKQVVNFLDSPEVPHETVQSVRSGLLGVEAWASTDWSVSLLVFVALCRSLGLSLALSVCRSRT